jgi:sulfur carrier protein
MHIQLSHPARTVEVKGPKKAKDLLKELSLVVEAHLVIRGDELVTEDEMLYDQDQIEIRPVISGGSPEGTSSVIGHSSIDEEAADLGSTNDDRRLTIDAWVKE